MIDNRGKTWTKEEREQLTMEFSQGMQLEEMVESHGRTPYAIVGKLVDLGLLLAQRTGYYRIEQDPWVLVSVLKETQKQSVEKSQDE